LDSRSTAQSSEAGQGTRSLSGSVLVAAAMILGPPLLAYGMAWTVGQALGQGREGEITTRLLMSLCVAIGGIAVAAIAWIRGQRRLAIVGSICWVLVGLYYSWLTLAFAG